MGQCVFLNFLFVCLFVALLAEKTVLQQTLFIRAHGENYVAEL